LIVQVLLEWQQLLLQFGNSAEGRRKRVVQLLNAQGFKEQFNSLETELRVCLEQLSTILNISQFASQVWPPIHLSA
jgi:hypothetical protein